MLRALISLTTLYKYCDVDLHISVYTREPWEQALANRLTRKDMTRKVGEGPRRVRDKSFQEAIY